jgi:murein DD-endopeptidase MepM/ murein hydrolase activator NlpD
VSHARRLSAIALTALALGAAQASPADPGADAQAQEHDGDRTSANTPPGLTTAAGIEPDATPIARLRSVLGESATLAWVDNLLDGPIEVMLHAEGPGGIASEPALPSRATVPPRSAGLLARIDAGNPRLRVAAVPGSPNARPRDVEYGYPLQSADLRIQQAWGGRYSHDDAENRYAVDFAAPPGTPVLAARDGLVLQAEDGFGDARPGDDPDLLVTRANYLRVLHDDGSMALYAHLRPAGVLVRVGQRVRRGEVIGQSGNTGRSTGPHLHFVLQANRGMRLESLPFRMFGPHGILRFGTVAADPD